MNWLNKLFKRGLTQDQTLILGAYNDLKTIENHLIAMCRLTFIKPGALVREAGNVKANAQYLLEMLETMKEKKI